MDLLKFYAPGTRQWQCKYSDKRTKKSVGTGTTVTIHENGFIKIVTTFNYEDESVYPTKQEYLLPISIFENGIAEWTKDDPEYGKIRMDLVHTGDLLIGHFQSENSEHKGSLVIEQINDSEYRETGFAYNSPDDVLKWEMIIKDK